MHTAGQLRRPGQLGYPCHHLLYQADARSAERLESAARRRNGSSRSVAYRSSRPWRFRC